MPDRCFSRVNRELGYDCCSTKRKDLSLYLKIAVSGLILTTQGHFLGPLSVLRFADSSDLYYAELVG